MTYLGQTWKEQKALWQGLAQRRQFLNNVYPSRVLHYQAPLEAYPQAVHSGRAYRPEWEEDLLDLSRVSALLAQGQWFHATNCHDEFWLGMQRYNMGRRWAKSSVEITFDPNPVEFVCKEVGTDQARRFPAKGISTVDLMGELSPMTRMPSFQLVLPFSRQEWRFLELARLMGGTTL